MTEENKKSCALDRRVTSYPPIRIYTLLKQRVAETGESESKIVTEALKKLLLPKDEQKTA